MYVEKLIQAAESCKYRRNCDGCPGKIGKRGCLLNGSMEKALLAAKTHYEQKLMLLREDINLLQRTMQTHKNVIADYKRQLEEPEILLKAERSKVIAEVREWAEDEENIYGDAMGNPVLCKYETLEKLDSMEPDKEEQ